VFPVDRPPIEHGVVTIHGERIVAVDEQPLGNELIDLGSVALLPGLVNAHTHLEFSGLRQPLGVNFKTPCPVPVRDRERGVEIASKIPLPDWIRLVIAERGRRNATQQEAITSGLHESVSHGVTTIGEIAASEPSAYCGADFPREPDATLFLEVIGFSRVRAASALAAATARLDELRRGAHRFSLGISPHAPYTVSLLLLEQLVGLARQQNLPMAMHLAESAEELVFLNNGTGPFQELLEERSMWDAAALPRRGRPIDYLHMLAESPRSLVIHGNYLDPVEHEFLATHRDRMTLVFCPRTHQYFGHPHYPLVELLSQGVKVALGTDSRASNPDLSLLAEMRHVARDYAAIDPSDILQMGTVNGAVALGCDNEVGSITPGKLANLVAIPLGRESFKAPADALNTVLAQDVAPCAVWLRGREVDRRS
jgi:cytosine/adenosine deaminase-related metal-dependent hydrolase